MSMMECGYGELELVCQPDNAVKIDDLITVVVDLAFN